MMNRNPIPIYFVMITLIGVNASAQTKVDQKRSGTKVNQSQVAVSGNAPYKTIASGKTYSSTDNRKQTVLKPSVSISSPSTQNNTDVKLQQNTIAGEKHSKTVVVTSKSKIESSNSDRTNGKGATNHKPGARLPVFIPPPPPTVPIGSISGLIGAPIAVLSAEDLKKRATELALQIADLKKEFTSKETRADEKRKRSTLFASLYTEGVVSRRELEASQHEDLEASEELKMARDKLETLHKEQVEIDTQLKKLAKRTENKPSKTISKNELKGSGKK